MRPFPAFYPCMDNTVSELRIGRSLNDIPGAEIDARMSRHKETYSRSFRKRFDRTAVHRRAEKHLCIPVEKRFIATAVYPEKERFYQSGAITCTEPLEL